MGSDQLAVEIDARAKLVSPGDVRQETTQTGER